MSMNWENAEADFDVVICGGGLAGLTLARQLQLEHPEVSVAVIDRLKRPLPEAGFKVGESMVELASYYLRDVVGLADYLDREHLRKLGLRMFFPSPTGDFADRPEVGLRTFASFPTHQIDRGRLENDLRSMVEKDGAHMLEGARIDSISLGSKGGLHKVSFYHGTDDDLKSVTAKWVIDSSGRSRTLQRQLGLATVREADHNAVWFRVPGRLDVDDLVPKENTEWHDRVPGQKRYFSTNHLTNKGYWVWIIPLSSNHTSVGIVALKDLHPIEKFKSPDLARKWLADKEPHFAKYLEGFEFTDFGAIRSYSHSSKQVFSADRWACTGDAGVFADPLYSPGSDLISFANCCISWMIGEDKAGRLTETAVEEKSRFVISIGELLTRSIQINYHIMGSANAMGAKLIWDFTAGWAVVQPLMFGKSFLDSEMHAKVRAPGRQFFFLSLQTNKLFADWAEAKGGNVDYKFIDYLSMESIRALRTRNLVPGKPIEELVADQVANMNLMEELAIAIFRVAVADVHPEHAHRLEGRWLNAWSINLDVTTWEKNGLFTPRTPARDITHLTEPLEAMFHVRQPQMM
jgi:flavin-dependent dehydrogenase